MIERDFFYIDLRLLKGLVWGLSYRLKSHLYSTLCIVQYIRQETQVGTPRCHTIDRLEVVWSFEGFVVLLLVLRGSVPAIEHVVEFLLHSLRVLIIHFPNQGWNQYKKTKSDIMIQRENEKKNFRMEFKLLFTCEREGEREGKRLREIERE